MKTKNVILGITAVLFAIGSAFASRLIVAPDYISVLYQNATPFTFKCTQIPFECNNQSAQLCKVNVVLANGLTTTAQVYDLPNDAINCTTALRDSRPIIGQVSKPKPIIAVRP